MENQPQRPLPNATAVLVLGIVSIVVCLCYSIPGIVCGIIAVVLSSKDMRLYNADPSLYTPGSFSNLKSGRICGIIGLSLSAAYLVFIIIYIFTVGWAFLSHPWVLHQSTM
jgi:hypothetical protein